ncbi:hypothetical protein QRX50_35145 [Amycolatopsis carbonis]|uniref:Uncharacterized protein n=1 Tax=Amycolatopsis carbonis TaxID=715471 RepID=A0A9Y2MTA7_9PSEU|nr:hypothetical protein [Amycolatopsis sp. 2-15]WIX76658.1 hypothetical protein QRX50_35145 [Amycolatopsis sp. 2-15]
MKVAAVLGSGHGMHVFGQDGPGIDVAADHRYLRLALEADVDAGAGCLPDFDSRQRAASAGVALLQVGVLIAVELVYAREAYLRWVDALAGE